MIRHISVFFFKEDKKEEHKRLFMARLAAMETELDSLMDYQVGVDCMQRPPKGISGLPEFGDAAQIIDFVNEEDAFSYPNHPAHVNLMRDMSDYLEKVVAIDIRL